MISLQALGSLSPVTGPASCGSTTVAVLMSCHNRRTLTMRSLKRLAAQTDLDATLAVVLVDDGSTDGTPEAVSTFFPAVTVVPADGSLYWSGGMALAQEHLLQDARPDFLCWLNDDVDLWPDALAGLFQAAAEAPACVVVGATVDPRSGELTYSGFRRASRLRPKRLVTVRPKGQVQPIDTFNGNVVLVPRQVYEAVGGIDSGFAHGLGDIDYGYRVARAGFGAVLAPGPVGTCGRNAPGGSWEDASVPLRRRLELLLAPKGLPFKSQARFYRRHGTALWSAQLLGLYVKAVARIGLSSAAKGLRGHA